MRATERAKSIDSYLTSEGKTMIRKNDVEKETETIWFLIETESAKNERKRKRRDRKKM